MPISILETEPTIAPYGFCFTAANKKEAAAIVKNKYYELAEWAWRNGLEAIGITHPGRKAPIQIPAKYYEERLQMPQNLLFADTMIPHEFRSYVDRMWESDAAMGIVEVASNRQILLSEQCRVYTPNLEQMKGQARSGYWFAPDLRDFMQRWQRELRDDGSNWIEVSYLCFPLNQPNSRDGWKRFTNRFSLILDRLGRPFHLCEAIAVEDAIAP